MLISPRTVLHWGLAVLSLLLSSSMQLQAQEIVPFGDGTTITVDEYLIETDQEDRKILVIRARPNFNPEPYGELPADDFARALEPLCRNLLANSWSEIEANDIGGVRVRWDFTPTQSDENLEAGITVSRFHEALFEIRRDKTCLAMPFGVGLDNLAPNLPSAVPAKLQYAERGLNPGELQLTYRVGEPLLGIPEERLLRGAMELCILHADMILADRAKYYDQLESWSVSIVFYSPDRESDFETTRRVTFPVRNGECVTGLSKILTDAIRSGI